jgi:hypothetical protein
MLPQYISESYETFYASFADRSDSDKEKFIREAAIFVQLSQDEVESLVTFVTDKNGIPYSAVNLKNLDVKEIHEIIVAVCMAIGAMKISIVSEDEKKNYLDSV